eukprot:1155302-Pelagomonas_calceolata.AAC.3
MSNSTARLVSRFCMRNSTAQLASQACLWSCTAQLAYNLCTSTAHPRLRALHLKQQSLPINIAGSKHTRKWPLSQAVTSLPSCKRALPRLSTFTRLLLHERRLRAGLYTMFYMPHIH